MQHLLYQEKIYKVGVGMSVGPELTIHVYCELDFVCAINMACGPRQSEPRIAIKA